MRIRIQEVKKPRKCTSSWGEFRTGRSKVRILNFFNVILKDLVEIFWVEFFFFSLYPLGSGSGSIWTFFGSWIRIRVIIDADPQHWTLQWSLTNVESKFLFPPTLGTYYSTSSYYVAALVLLSPEAERKCWAYTAHGVQIKVLPNITVQFKKICQQKRLLYGYLSN